MELTLSSKVPPADAGRALESLATEGEHPNIVWDYATRHLDEMQKRFGFFRWNRLLPSIAEGFTDEAKAIELLNFVKSNLSPAAIKEAESSTNLIVFHAKLKAKELPAIDKWITDKMATTSRE